MSEHLGYEPHDPQGTISRITDKVLEEMTEWALGRSRRHC
jgi:hypothetical protein